MKSLIEFIADSDSVLKKYGKETLQHLCESIIEHPFHQGDCTNESCPCNMCGLKTTLDDYKKYFKEERRKLTKSCRAETPQAKLRNQLSPIYGLADMVLRMEELPKEMIIAMARTAMENRERIKEILIEIDELNSE